jgi:hypothetical protein
MPRVVVITDHTEQSPRGPTVLLDESVHSLHLDTDHAAIQFVERIGWAISDAEDLESGPEPSWASA